MPGDVIYAVSTMNGVVADTLAARRTSMAVVGVGAGVFLALSLTRLMSSQLYGVSDHDPLTFAAVALALLVVALIACWLPARRAMRVDPIIALRSW
jgi:putative ABC transport system permease protein